MSETMQLSQKEKREQRKKARREARAERDSALHYTKTIYEPKIQALKDEWREATREIEKNYEEELSKADKI